MSAWLMLLAVAVLHAQPADTITARTNPAPVALRPVWALYGAHEQARVGEGIGGIPDINGDSIDEFTVFSDVGCSIYYGSKEPLSMEPAIVMPYTVLPSAHPITGRFWGGDRKALVLIDGAIDTITIRGNPTSVGINRWWFFDASSGKLDTTPILHLDPRMMAARTSIPAADMAAVDLDGDGADEFIIYTPSVYRAGKLTYTPEVWIYRGGSNFQVDSPTVILRDSDIQGGSGNGRLFIGRWDKDQYPDIATGSDYADGTQRLKFWFGGPDSPWNWTMPGKVVNMADVPSNFIVALDCDGDSVLDLVVPPSVVYRDRVRLYLSGSGKDTRTRSFDSADVDRTFYSKDFTVPERLGYISDSLRRYEMLGLGGAYDGGPTSLFGFNGGPNGPDQHYDAYEASNEIFSLCQSLGDVTGDGWNDFIIGYSGRGGFHQGFAMIWAGGPYIPHDSGTTGVEDVAVAGVRDAISLWPNPMHEELHIAWRGDMHRMPARFAVHDMLGREVARGEVESWHGEALWKCGERPAGVYMVSIYDEHGALITTARVVKQ